MRLPRAVALQSANDILSCGSVIEGRTADQLVARSVFSSRGGGGGAGGRGGEKSGALMWAAEGIYVTCGMAAGREGVLLVYAVI